MADDEGISNEGRASGSSWGAAAGARRAPVGCGALARPSLVGLPAAPPLTPVPEPAVPPPPPAPPPARPAVAPPPALGAGHQPAERGWARTPAKVKAAKPASIRIEPFMFAPPVIRPRCLLAPFARANLAQLRLPRMGTCGLEQVPGQFPWRACGKRATTSKMRRPETLTLWAFQGDAELESEYPRSGRKPNRNLPTRVFTIQPRLTSCHSREC